MIALNEIQVDEQITHLALVGKLDVSGMHTVDMKFHGYTAARRRPTLVDLAGLEFISSLGISMFVSCARALQRHNAKLVLLNPRPEIEDALRAVGIDQGVPIVHNVEEAMRLLFPPAS
jgi:anti-anti-sigma factor